MKVKQVFRCSRVGGAVIALFLCTGQAYAEKTAGGINWLDPLTYQKPAFVSIDVPGEASAPKYYVDLANGSGTSCTQSAPCAITGVAGKPGTAGGPAYVYLKGTGAVNLFQPKNTFYGSPGKEIVIKPWPAGTTGCASGCTATITSTASNNLTGSNIHHWIVDGGPNMGITIEATGGDNRGMRVNADYITLYRIQGRCNLTTKSGSSILAISAGKSTGFKVINSEFYGCESGDSDEQQSAIYYSSSGCFDGASGYDNALWQNNIVRQMNGEGLEINPRTASTGLTIVGSAFHDIGKGTCGGNWGCRPAITINDCGGSASGIKIQNNLMWDLGSSCVWTKGAGSDRTFSNNTCFDYGKGAGTSCQQGICGGTTATIRNSIIYAPNGENPFDGTAFTATNNLCGANESCGTAKQSFSSSTFLSTTENDPKFLKPGPSSEAVSTGVNLYSLGITTDYSGVNRSTTGTFDLGAFASGSQTTPPPPPPASPTNVRIIK